jgi:hypothetical protein
MVFCEPAEEIGVLQEGREGVRSQVLGGEFLITAFNQCCATGKLEDAWESVKRRGVFDT